MKGKLLFEEEQLFNYTWIWWLMMIVAIPSLLVFGYGVYQQLFLGEPWGNNPMSDTTMIVVVPLIYLILGGVVWLFMVMKLVIKIDQSTITYSFHPFISRTRVLHSTDLKNQYVRKYHPIFEYGGWGYRFLNSKDLAYNVKGKWGLQLVFTNGKKLLLGTQKPKELEQALITLKTNWGMKE